MRRQLITTAVCIMAVSLQCSFSKGIEETALSEAIKASAEILAAEPVNIVFDYDTLAEPPFMLVYEGYIICSHMSSETPGDKLLEIYRPDRKKPIYTAAEYGSRKGQFLSAQPHLHGDTLVLHDVVKDCITTIDLRKALTNSKYTPEVIDIDFLTNEMMPYKGGLLYLSPYWTDDSRVSSDEAGKKLLVTGPGFAPGWEDGKYLTINISAGILISNRDRDRILYFDRNDDIAEVYDYSLNPLRRITGPDNVQPVFAFPSNEDEGNIPMQKSGIYDTYIGACGNGSDVYAAYLGKDYDSGEPCSYILNFDWNGNCKRAYRINGTIYYYISYYDGYVYASVTDRDGITKLNKFKVE